MITNSLFVLNKDGDIVPPHYSKTILLAFGEYIPGEQFFPEIRGLAAANGSFCKRFWPNHFAKLEWLQNGRANMLWKSVSRIFALTGWTGSAVHRQCNQRFLVWHMARTYQHMYMTLARGVEFRRPVLRVTNTGISTVSLASGEILERSPIHQPWAGLYEVPYLKNPPVTFYQNWFG